MNCPNLAMRYENVGLTTDEGAAELFGLASPSLLLIFIKERIELNELNIRNTHSAVCDVEMHAISVYDTKSRLLNHKPRKLLSQFCAT